MDLLLAACVGALALAIVIAFAQIGSAFQRLEALERRVAVLDDPFAPPPVGLDAPPHRER